MVVSDATLSVSRRDSLPPSEMVPFPGPCGPWCLCREAPLGFQTLGGASGQAGFSSVLLPHRLVQSASKGSRPCCPLTLLQMWLSGSHASFSRRPGERPYKCQTCERTFTLKHSLVRHQRVHQKARHAKAQGKDSDKDAEDSGSESTHSGNHPASEGETDLASVPRGHKESPALARDAGGREDRAAKRTAELGQAEAGRSPPRASDGPREQATQADPERDSPAGPTQDLSEPQAGRTAVAEDASPLLGME